MIPPNLARLQELTEKLHIKDEESEKAQAVLQSFFDLSVDLLCVMDFKGHFKKLNHSWETLGWSCEELYSKPFLDYIHVDDQKRTKHAYNSALNGEQVTYFRNRHLCKDGSYKILCWTAHPDMENKLIYCVARDFSAMMEKTSE